VGDTRELAGRLPHRYESLQEACARMQQANAHLSPDQAAGDTGVWGGAGTELARMALASIGEWLHAGLAGLDMDSDLSESHHAFRRMRIQPHPPLGVVVAAYGPPFARPTPAWSP
jgi:hypothetical protein